MCAYGSWIRKHITCYGNAGSRRGISGIGAAAVGEAGAFPAVLETLPPEQMDVVIDYIGVGEEQLWRGMEVTVNR